MVTYAYESPTSHLETSGDWTNPARAYDGNWSNYANVVAEYWNTIEIDHWRTNWLTLIMASSGIFDRIHFKIAWTVPAPTESIVDFQVYNQTTGVWDTIWEDLLSEGTYEIAIPNTTTDRFKVSAQTCGMGNFFLYEFEARRVTPDSPNVPPPEQSTVVEQVKIEQESSSASARGISGSRMRSKHRRTKLVPVILG